VFNCSVSYIVGSPLPCPPFSRFPLVIQSGSGCFLKTVDGRKYLDCVSGIATCALGHNNPALTKAVTEQIQTVHHVSNLYLIPEQAALAAWLCENSGADRVFFCNSGAEANEAAIKLARRHASDRGVTVSSSSLRHLVVSEMYSHDPPHSRSRSETCHNFCGAIIPWTHPCSFDCYCTAEVPQGFRL